MVKKYPGFIDVHVHLRDPGATQKEDFATGSRAAVAGGFTYILDMPNNPIPTFSPEALEVKRTLVKQKAVCDVGFHYGTNGKNTESFKNIWNDPDVFGLKLYCNHTTGNYLIDDSVLLEHVFKAWNSTKPILVHAEGEKLELVLHLAGKYRKHLHVCHITLKDEVRMVRSAKKSGRPVSAGACPHHLFLTDNDVKDLGPYAMMKPPLGTKTNQDALWEGINDGTIDLVETDHAPHTKEEKHSDKPPAGVPGLETAVGLMFLAVYQKRISGNLVEKLLYTAPKRIFSIPDQPDTYVELDAKEQYIAGAGGYETKCQWSPFDGWKLRGKVYTVVVRGKTVVANGKII